MRRLEMSLYGLRKTTFDSTLKRQKRSWLPVIVEGFFLHPSLMECSVCHLCWYWESRWKIIYELLSMLKEHWRRVHARSMTFVSFDPMFCDHQVARAKTVVKLTYMYA